jgi:acetylornithine deacetylase/succinyl-diaminopimelate desuccinylase-like protein
MDKAIEFAEARENTSLQELFEYLRIPSISTLSDHDDHTRRAAQWTADQLRQIGMSRVEIYATPRHPIVYAEHLAAPGAPTVLIYGHYDVQPVDPLEEWEQPPFEPYIKDDHIVTRGAADDKGQTFINFKAIEALLAVTDGKLPLNVKFLIEGEEEVGSASLPPFMQANREMLAADTVVISDTTMHSLEQPAISTSFRGMMYVDVTVRGPAFDLHSGQHGGVVHNPVQALCEIVAALHHPDGSVAVDGFYDKVRPIDDAERAELAQLYSEEEFRAETGAPQPWGEAQYNLRERIVARPTLELNGINGGFTGEGRKTVLPAKATAKISCRLVPDQDPYEIEQLVRRQIEALTPPTVRVEIETLSYGHPIRVPTDSPAMQAAVRAYEKGFGARPIFMRKGGSLPAVALFSEMLGVPVILAGYGLPTDRVHGPNERFHLECYRRGLRTAITLYDELARIG